LNAGWHHLINLLLHLANTLLLLHWLHRWTGSVWRSALVAALFAWHPLHVESVAWASERKDVLSTLFWLLTLFAYENYVRKSGPGRYVLTLFVFALGLMSKPMVVTLPCVLLLLDIWPLQRWRLGGGGEKDERGALGIAVGRAVPSAPSLAARTLPFLVREKIPFFALAAISSLVTYLVQQQGGAVSSFESIPFGSRIANALTAYLGYVLKTFWPAHLAPIYPYSRHLPLWEILLAGSLMAGTTAWVFWRIKSRPWLAVGWLWFVGTLVPTIGLIQVGSQSMADRYTYIPSIGFFIMLVWGLAEWLERFPRYRPAVAGAAATAALIGCVTLTSLQLRHWRDAEALFRHTLAVSSDKYIAYNYLGKAVEDAGRPQEALGLYMESIRLKPGYAEGEYNVGTLLLAQGDLTNGARHFETAIKTHPKYAAAHNNLGSAWFKMGRMAEAKAQFVKAIALAPSNPEAHYNLGVVWLGETRFDEAIQEFLQAVRLRPGYAAAHGNLGVALMNRGKVEWGLAHFAEAVRLNPGFIEARLNLGIGLLEHGQAEEAARQFTEGLRQSPGSPQLHYYLALSLGRQHNTREAVAYAQKARTLALASGQSELAAKAQQFIDQN